MLRGTRGHVSEDMSATRTNAISHTLSSMELELRHLHALTTLADTRSVSAAARQLGIEQPNLTRQLHRIEQELDALLFRRTRTGTTVTPLGRVVVEQARVALDRVDRIRGICRNAALASQRPETLRVRTYGIPLERLRAELPSHLRRDSWIIDETSPPQAVRDIRTGLADVFIGIRWPHATWLDTNQLITIELVRQPMVIQMAADNPLADRGIINLQELEDEVWVSRSDTTTMECRRAGFSPKVGSTPSDPYRYQELLRTGQAVSFSGLGFACAEGVAATRYHRASHVYIDLVFNPDHFLPEHAEMVAAAFVHSYDQDSVGWTTAAAV